MTLAVLSWKAHKTLVNSLNTYRLFGLDRLDEEKVIFFQEITNQDREIAKEFGYEAIGTPDNIGIAEGYKRLVEYATGELFLFLENDWALIEDPWAEISRAERLLKYGVVDVARLRHRKNPGNPLYTRQFEGNELSRPEHLLDCMYWTDPMAFEPLIWRTEMDWEERVPGWYESYSKNANWTNNPTMFRTEWLRNVVVPHMGSRDVEIDVQAWWEQTFYIVAQGDGLFTHNRLD